MNEETRHSRAGLAGLNPGIRGEEGFTLAEMMVFLAIMVIFLVGIGGMITSGVNSSTASYNVVKMGEAGNSAMSTMIRQIRVAASVDVNSGSSRLTFTGDLDGDDVGDTQDFRLEGGYLMMGDLQWIADAYSVQFTYYWYDETDKQVKELAAGSAGWNTAIRRVDIELVLARQSGRNTIYRTYTGSVTLRNVLDQD